MLPDPGVPLSLSQIQGEFGGDEPISLSEYYDAAPGIPVSGEIGISDFYSKGSGNIPVQWCSITDPSAYTSNYLYDYPDVKYDGITTPVSDSRYVTLLRDSDDNFNWSGLCVFDLSGRGIPVVSDFPPFPTTGVTLTFFSIVPKNSDEWFIPMTNASYLEFNRFVIATFDGTDVSYSSIKTVHIDIYGSGWYVQRYCIISESKILFLSSDRKSEDATGNSEIRLCVADVNDNGVFSNIGNRIEFTNAGFGIVEIIDDSSFICITAPKSGTTIARKFSIDEFNDIAELGSTTIGGGIYPHHLLSDILILKFGDDIRAVFDTSNPEDETTSTSWVMLNVTDDVPVGVEAKEMNLNGAGLKVNNAEWDSLNNSAMIITPRNNAGSSTISFDCIGLTTSGFGELVNVGVISNTDADRKYPSLSAQRNRRIVDPFYRMCMFYGQDSSVTGFNIFTLGVPESFSNPPTIISTPVTDATEGTEYTYDVEATGDAPITFSLDVSPTGMAIDGTTGIVTWTPDGTQVGDNDVDVKASNSGGTDNQPFTITVVDAPSSEYKYAGYPSDENGVPNPPIGDWQQYGASGSKVYAMVATMGENGTAVAVNIRAVNPSIAGDNTYVVLYNGEDLIGKAPLYDNPANDWSGYIEIVAEAGGSLDFNSGDVLYFGLSNPDYTPGQISNEDDGAEIEKIRYSSDLFVDVPPTTIDGWSTSGSNYDLGSILKYSPR